MKSQSVEPLTPIYTAELFSPLHQELLALLRGLTPADWERPTVAGSWRVRDVAAHLLDVSLRKLSFQRDGHLATIPQSADLGCVRGFHLRNGFSALLVCRPDSGLGYLARSR